MQAVYKKRQKNFPFEKEEQTRAPCAEDQRLE